MHTHFLNFKTEDHLQLETSIKRDNPKTKQRLSA